MMSKPRQHVYLMTMERWDYVDGKIVPTVIFAKIGIATDVRRRRKELQRSLVTVNPLVPNDMRVCVKVWSHDMKAEYAEAREMHLHSKYAKHRTSGEWFHVDEELLKDMEHYVSHSGCDEVWEFVDDRFGESFEYYKLFDGDADAYDKWDGDSDTLEEAINQMRKVA